MSAPVERARDIDLINAACGVTNGAYEVAEAGLWRAGYLRTHFEDTSKAVADDELVLAYLDDSLVGAVRTRVMDVATGWFGALSVDPDLGGQGIGAELVSAIGKSAEATFLSLSPTCVPLCCVLRRRSPTEDSSSSRPLTCD
jgi:GNAT superfamily N-acetyltransferase